MALQPRAKIFKIGTADPRVLLGNTKRKKAWADRYLLNLWKKLQAGLITTKQGLIGEIRRKGSTSSEDTRKSRARSRKGAIAMGGDW